jgi:uncharacterized protein YozE (UPF0346 family)
LKEQTNIAEAKELFKAEYKENASSFDEVWNSWKESWIAANFFRV